MVGALSNTILFWNGNLQAVERGEEFGRINTLVPPPCIPSLARDMFCGLFQRFYPKGRRLPEKSS